MTDRIHRGVRGTLVGLLGASWAPAALAEQFDWSPQCDHIWQSCCPLNQETMTNNWNRTSPAPLCPALPTANDEVFIGSDCTVAPAPFGPASAGTLTQSAGAFTLENTLSLVEAQFDGPFIWNSGDLTRAGGAAGQFAIIRGGMTIQGAADRSLSFLGGFELINQSSILWTGSGDFTIGMIPGGCCPSILTNEAGATFTVKSDARILSNAFGVGVINNAGTLVKSDSNGVSEWAVNLNNSGLVHVQTGELKLTRAGEIAGDWVIDPGAQLSIAGNFFTLSPDVSISGRAVVMQSGTNVGINVNEDVTIDDLVIASDGRLGGTGVLRIAGTLTNDAGFPTVHMHILPEGHLQANGVGQFFGKLEVEGTASLPAGANMGCFNSVLTVLPGGAFTIDDGATLGQTGLGTQPIVNHGLLRKPPTSGTAVIASAFNWYLNNEADGVIDVEGGTLECYNRLESFGRIEIAAGATFKQRTWATYHAGTVIAGEGWFDLLAGNNFVDDGFELTIPRFRIAGSVGGGQGITGAGALRVTHELEASGGVLGTSLVTLDPAATMRVIGPDFVQVYNTFANYGLIELEAVGMVYGSLNNQPGGRIEIHNDTHLGGRFGGGTLNNQGELVKVSGVSSQIDTSIVNSGLFEIMQGDVITDPYVQSAGVTRLHGATLTAGSLTLNGGLLTGAGVLAGAVVNNGAVIEPGDGPGALAITGSYSQGPGGKLRIELGGTTPGAGYDQLTVSAAATLGGAVELVPAAGFSPQVGQQFTILTRASGSGQFASVSGYGGGGYSVAYNPTSVVVTVTAPPCLGDFNNNGAVGIDDLAVVIGGYGMTQGATYDDGDLDGDGDVDLGDLALILNRYGESCG